MRQSRETSPASGQGAVNALLVTALVAAVLTALGRPGWTWSEAGRSLHAAPWPWTAVAGLLPIGEPSGRVELVAYTLLVATSTAAAWAGFALFRGRARGLAAITGGTLTAVVLLHWLHSTGPEALTTLPAAVLATLAITELVRSLVHGGHVTPLASARALAASSGVALFHAPWGLTLFGLVGAISWVRSSRRSGPGWWLAVLSCSVPALLAGLGSTFSIGRAPGLGLTGAPPLELGLPRLDLLEPHLPAVALYPAVALLVLLVMPLRWRGGPTLVVLATVALVLHAGGRPLAPTPVLLVLACVATAGWVWLAGTALPRFPRLERVLAFSVALVIVGVVSTPLREVGLPPTPLEHPSHDFARLHDAALERPGTVLLVHDPWMHGSFTDRRTMGGWRPDVELVDAIAVDDEDLLAATTRWHTRGRLVLSDSFDAAGRWPVQWVVEHGPLFAFSGPVLEEAEPSDDVERAERAWRLLSSERDARSSDERGHIVRQSVERARFRRSVDDPHAALEALELPRVRQRSLETRLQLAVSVRPSSGVASELPGGVVDRAWLLGPWFEHRDAEAGTHPALTAEAGDLLYAHGERERAVELLAEAAAEGYLPAWGALARWQLRAGEEAGHATLRAMASTSGLRRELLDTLEWLLARERIVDVRAHLETMPTRPEGEIEELAVRLLLIRAMAGSPTTTVAEAPTERDTLTRR